MNPVWQLCGMRRPTPPACKTRNWPVDNAALKRRGSLTIWFDPAMIWEAAPTVKRGRQLDYSDAAPDLSDDEGAVRHGTQADDRFRRELALVDRPRLDGAELQHPQPSPEDVEGQHPVSRFAGPLHLLIDSTGIKVEGEGE